MKDYFDLWVLLDDTTLGPSEVRRAVEATFERRKMSMPTTVPVGFTDIFADSMKACFRPKAKWCCEKMRTAVQV